MENEHKGNIKHVKITRLGGSSIDLTVQDDWTVEKALTAAGMPLSGRIKGIMGEEQRDVTLDEPVNGFDELVVISKVTGGLTTAF